MQNFNLLESYSVTHFDDYSSFFLQIVPPVLVQAESCNLSAQYIRRLTMHEVFKLILLASDNAFVSGTLCFGHSCPSRFRTR